MDLFQCSLNRIVNSPAGFSDFCRRRDREPPPAIHGQIGRVTLRVVGKHHAQPHSLPFLRTPLQATNNLALSVRPKCNVPALAGLQDASGSVSSEGTRAAQRRRRMQCSNVARVVMTASTGGHRRGDSSASRTATDASVDRHGRSIACDRMSCQTRSRLSLRLLVSLRCAHFARHSRLQIHAGTDRNMCPRT